MKKYVIGVDECGYGSWAGPLVVCAFKAPINWTIEGLRDSKKLSEKKRRVIWSDLARLTELKKDNYTKSTYCVIDNILIDKIGLGVAHKSAFIHAISQLYDHESNVICDGNLSFHNEILIEQGISPKDIKSIVKADDKIPVVMAASILGKVYRDIQMCNYSKEIPGYDFDQHKGYGTKKHKEAIKKLGFSRIHRMSYKIKGL